MPLRVAFGQISEVGRSNKYLVMKYYDREIRRELIRQIMELYFGDDGDFNACRDCPMDEVSIRERERVRLRAAEFLLNDKDADLKDEVLLEKFQQICEQYPNPKELDWNDVVFFSKVFGRSPHKVKESIERESGKKIIAPC
jgi:hypothetical protein